MEAKVPSVYLKTFVGLMVLLALTVGAAFVPFGAAGVGVALLIAAAKAVLILLFFMHLMEANGLHRLFSVVGFLWFLILLTLTLADYLSRPTIG